MHSASWVIQSGLLGARGEGLAQTVAELLQDISRWSYLQIWEDAPFIITFPAAKAVVHNEFPLDLQPWQIPPGLISHFPLHSSVRNTEVHIPRAAGQDF